jgi:ParB-like chromosome segregation protein Spo0J
MNGKTDEAATQLPVNIKHVHGTLYEIPHDAIYIAKKGEIGANIRYLSGDDESLGVGFEKADMDRLHASIRDQGLHNPLICRWVTRDGQLSVQLVDGERRWRTIDRLLVKNEKVYDPATKRMVPAKELYSNLLIRVYDASTDKEAMKLSYQENRSRVAFNDKVDISLVKDLRDKSFTDDEICEITGQKSDWLRDTDKLITALSNDPDTLAALSNGVVNRDAALVFIGIEDMEVRKEAIKTATEYADKQYKKKMEKIQKSIQKAKIQREEAAASEAEAKFDGDADAGAAAKEKKAAANKRIDDKTREKSETKPEVGGRAARKASKKVSGARPQDGQPRSMSNKKVNAEFIVPFDALIKSGGIPEGEEKPICHPDVIKAMRDVAKAIATGDEGQALRLVKKWGKTFAEEWKAPKPVK